MNIVRWAYFFCLFITVNCLGMNDDFNIQEQKDYLTILLQQYDTSKAELQRKYGYTYDDTIVEFLNIESIQQAIATMQVLLITIPLSKNIQEQKQFKNKIKRNKIISFIMRYGIAGIASALSLPYLERGTTRFSKSSGGLANRILNYASNQPLWKRALMMSIIYGIVHHGTKYLKKAVSAIRAKLKPKTQEMLLKQYLTSLENLDKHPNSFPEINYELYVPVQTSTKDAQGKANAELKAIEDKKNWQQIPESILPKAKPIQYKSYNDLNQDITNALKGYLKKILQQYPKDQYTAIKTDIETRLKAFPKGNKITL